MKKRLKRSSIDNKLAGICGGLAEYFDIDPTLVRVAFVLLTLLPIFNGILAYIILWIIIPKDNAI